jgi:hypothetical protein
MAVETEDGRFLLCGTMIPSVCESVPEHRDIGQRAEAGTRS